MAATVLIEEMSAATTGVDKTSGTVRFKSADENTVDTTNRLQVPAAGINYSYTKQLRFNITVAPSVDLQNLNAYSDGASGFGVGIGVQLDVPDGGLGIFPNIVTSILPADWAASTAYNLGDMVKPTVGNDRWFVCTTAGTSGASEPTWTTTINDTTTDNTATWTAIEGDEDLFSRTSSVVIDMDAHNVGPHTGTGYKGDILRMQMTVASTATPGTLTAETLTFSYDET